MSHRHMSAPRSASRPTGAIAPNLQPPHDLRDGSRRAQLKPILDRNRDQAST